MSLEVGAWSMVHDNSIIGAFERRAHHLLYLTPSLLCGLFGKRAWFNHHFIMARGKRLQSVNHGIQIIKWDPYDALHETDRLHKQNKQEHSTRGKYFKELLVALENTYKWTRRGFDVTRRMGKWYLKTSW